MNEGEALDMTEGANRRRKVLFSEDVHNQSVTQTRIVFRTENDRPENSLSELRREVRRHF